MGPFNKAESREVFFLSVYGMRTNRRDVRAGHVRAGHVRLTIKSTKDTLEASRPRAPTSPTLQKRLGAETTCAQHVRGDTRSLSCAQPSLPHMFRIVLH